MATIVKRGNKYSVVYNYTDENGVTRQKWEPPIPTKKEAQKRKNEIEHEMATGTFIVPSTMKVKDFLNEFVEMYGLRKWGLSMYSSNTGLIRNYINPVLGDMNVQQPGLDAVQLLLQPQGNPEFTAVLKGLLNTNLFG